MKEHIIPPCSARFKPVKEHTVTPQYTRSKPVKEHILTPRTFTKNGHQKKKRVSDTKSNLLVRL